MSQPSHALISLLCRMIDGNSALAMPSGRGRPYLQASGAGDLLVSLSTAKAAIAAGHLVRQERANWTVSSYTISEAGRALAEAHRSMLVPAERRLVVTVALGNTKDNPLRVGALCEVMRETSARVYVRVVQNPSGRTMGLIEGHGADLYVSARNIAHRDVTEEQYACLVTRARSYQAARAEMMAAREAAIAAAEAPFREQSKALAEEFQRSVGKIIEVK